MLANLDDIPSPYLTGCFDAESHPISIFETNRGCPYKCTFCTWGGDTLKVTKFSLDRVKEELLWLVKKQTLFFYLADANWGILSRDVELSEYIARLKRDFGFPLMVYYAAAKNKPKASVACIEKFHEGGVIASQALGIQSMNTDTLTLIDRQNIRNSAFLQMFDDLKQREIDSYCELIWPLPGETLETLGAGIQELLSLGARTVIVYPAILINNARLTDQTAEHEMKYVTAADWKSELRLVKATKWADRATVDAGFWLYYAQFLLSNLDRDKVLLKYLAAVTGKSYARIFSDFGAYLRTHVDDSAYGALIASIFRLDEHGSLLTIGRLATHLTHDCRLSAQRDVLRFVASQAPGDIDDHSSPFAIALLWALSMPKLFSDTVEDAAELLSVCDQLRGGGESWSTSLNLRDHKRVTALEMVSTVEVWPQAVAWFIPDSSPREVSRIAIHHPAVGLAYNRRDAKRNYVYAHGMIQRLTLISPELTASGTYTFGHSGDGLDAVGERAHL
jgi:radical SAM family protein